MTNTPNENNRRRRSQPKKPDKAANKKRNKRIIFSILSVLVVAVIGYGIYFVYGIIKSTDTFSIEKLVSQEATEMYDTEGGSMGMWGNDEAGTRENVTYEQLPQVLVDAVVATEDSRFFDHNGFDLPRIIKAAFGNLLAGDITSGGSTITQQLIKKSYYPDEHTNRWQRKIGEIYLAIQADSQLDKEKILELYLNKIAFGRGNKTIGIQAASKYYFDKDVSELTLPEAALLAGTLNAPDAFDPYYHLEDATKRRDTVLDLMYRHGYISEDEMNATKQIKIENTLKKSANADTDYTNYASYTDTVLSEYYELASSGKYPELAGLDPLETPMEIHTFMDPDAQAYADSIASGELFNFYDDNLELGASVQDTHTGKIIAVIGGRHYTGVTTPEREAVETAPINYALEKHQPGSSLKPIISYCAAFEFLDWSTGQSVSNEAYTTPEGHRVNNWDFSVGGEVQLQEALRNSLNLPAIHTFNKVLEKINLTDYQKYVEGFGFDLSDESFNTTYSIGSWDHGITPVQGAGAYAALSNNGNYIQPHTIDYIILKDTGTKIDVHNSITPTQALSAESSFMIQQVLKTFAKTQYIGTNINYNLAAKSGTSDWGDSGVQFGIPEGANKDSWFQGYTEDLAVSVWVGYPGSIASTYGYYLSYDQTNFGSKIGAMLIDHIQNGTTVNSYTQPSGVSQATMVKGITPYMKPDSSTPSDSVITAWFKNSNMPKDYSLASQLAALTSFDVTGEANNLNVKFGAYDKSADDKNVINIYGDAIYGVEVRDPDTGAVLYSQTSETPEFKLNYTPEKSVVIVGFYTRSKALTIRSSEKSVTVTIKPKTAEYIVNYYKDDVLFKSEKGTGTIGATITPDIKKYQDAAYNTGVANPTSIKIAADGSSVINVYYTKKTPTTPETPGGSTGGNDNTTNNGGNSGNNTNNGSTGNNQNSGGNTQTPSS